MSIKIEDAIPIHPRGRETTLPIADLQVGQSFFVPADEQTKESQRRLQARLCSASRKVRTRNAGREFVTRALTEGELIGVRIWRTS